MPKSKLHGHLAYIFILPVWRVLVGHLPPRAYVQIEYKNRILMVQNWLGSGGWSYPGGGLHKGEDSKVGACREIFEEIGLTFRPDDIDLLTTGVTKYLIGKKKFTIYKISLKNKPNIVLDSELNGFVWATRDEIRKYKISKDVEVALAAEHNGQSVII